MLVGNDKARRTYERAGFRETGRLIGIKGEIPAGATSAALALPAVQGLTLALTARSRGAWANGSGGGFSHTSTSP